MFTIPILIALYAGFTHAFEADHLLAVSNIVSSRNNIRLSLKDGAWWGLGHASTILLVGTIVLLSRSAISKQLFSYFEVVVGIMLVLLSLFRLYKLFYQTHKRKRIFNDETITIEEPIHHHRLAYGVGLVHGLAGSGALMLIVLTQIKAATQGMFYLGLFGIGAIAGMCFAAGLFSVPFSRQLIKNKNTQTMLVVISSVLCMFYGGFVVYKNLGMLSL